MGAAHEQRFARLNRERFSTDLLETVTVLESTWDRVREEKTRHKERADAAERRNAELERDMARARRLISVLESSRTTEREQRAIDEAAREGDRAFRCSLMRSAVKRADDEARRADQAMTVIKRVMSPNEYHQIRETCATHD